MATLDQLTQSRDNNFHLLRMIAASLVLVSHCFALATGDVASEPLRSSMGLTLGSMAVDVFFVASGLLVTQSLMRSADALTFVRARVLRIWPGLLVALLLTVFVLGPAVTSLPMSDYFTDRGTWRYLLLNAVLLHGTVFTLPGVFDNLPYARAVNGSLWTLGEEVRCYLLLLGVWWLVGRRLSERWFGLLVAALWLFLLARLLLADAALDYERLPPRVYLMFASGALLYLWRDLCPVDWRMGATAGALMVLAVVWPASLRWTYTLALPMAVLVCAYLPRGPWLAYNRVGDYSYGVYIYAFPLQQLLVACLPGVGPWGLFAVSMTLTLAFAAASWHAVEAPAQAWGRKWSVPRS